MFIEIRTALAQLFAMIHNLFATTNRLAQVYDSLLPVEPPMDTRTRAQCIAALNRRILKHQTLSLINQDRAARS